MPKNSSLPPKVRTIRRPMNQRRMRGMCLSAQERTRLFWMVGSTLFFTTFSMMSGTEHTMVGRTFFIAASRMVGVGGFWSVKQVAPT